MAINDMTLLGTLARNSRSETPDAERTFGSCALRMREYGCDGMMHYTILSHDGSFTGQYIVNSHTCPPPVVHRGGGQVWLLTI